jgi:GST-like protein
MLEELELAYRVKSYDLIQSEQLSAEFLALNPVGRLPTLVDRDVAQGEEPITVYGSAAILIYLAEKTGQFLPRTPRERARVFEWLGIVSGDLGPAYSGQFVFNVVAREKQPWAIDFYNALCTRLLGPLEQQLGRTAFLAGEQYSIADIIAYPVKH